MKVLRAALVALLLVVGLAHPASADHIRAMVAYQANGSATTGEITLRVDFNYSGNCCGGAFSWDTGETVPRYAWVPDGIDNGAYTFDVPPTTDTFSDGSTFTWSRVQPDPGVPLVRIDITWTYPVAGSYVVTWSDCCPQSNQKAVVVSGQQFEPQRILAPDPGSGALATAFRDAQIPACPVVPPTPPATPPPLCYELVSAVALPATLLSSYDAIVVGTETQATTITALGTPTGAIETWLQSPDARGIAVYGQTSPSSWSWLPTAGQPLTVTSVFANDVTVTPAGMAHLSHVNQLPTVGPVNGTLAGWNMSTYDTFSAWPSYLGPNPGAALAARTNGAAVALAGHYPGGQGCQVITGTPVDDRAATGNRAAQQLFRSTLAYALTCVDAARA